MGEHWVRFSLGSHFFGGTPNTDPSLPCALRITAMMRVLKPTWCIQGMSRGEEGDKLMCYSKSYKGPCLYLTNTTLPVESESEGIIHCKVVVVV